MPGAQVQAPVPDYGLLDFAHQRAGGMLAVTIDDHAAANALGPAQRIDPRIAFSARKVGNITLVKVEADRLVLAQKLGHICSCEFAEVIAQRIHKFLARQRQQLIDIASGKGQPLD